MSSTITQSDSSKKTNERFASPDADFIVRSSDEIEFRVFARFLTEASPVFRDMMSLPQPAQPSSSTSHSPVFVGFVDVSEDAKTLEPLLQLVCPVDEPVLVGLSDLAPVLHAAIKYDMRKAISRLRDFLVRTRFLDTNPVRVYAIACRYGFEPEAKLASTHTLKHDLITISDIPEFEHISAAAYLRLLSLHRTRAKAAIQLLQPMFSSQCAGNCFEEGGVPRTTGPFTPKRTSLFRVGNTEWWKDYVSRASQELERRPMSDVITDFDFIAPSAIWPATSCPGCPKHVLSERKYFKTLKEKIDALPSTV